MADPHSGLDTIISFHYSWRGGGWSVLDYPGDWGDIALNSPVLRGSGWMGPVSSHCDEYMYNIIITYRMYVYGYYKSMCI